MSATDKSFPIASRIPSAGRLDSPAPHTCSRDAEVWPSVRSGQDGD
jgi:hypothetical protein